MISVMISSLSLKLYLNSLKYHGNIFRSPSKVFGNLRTSSEIFRNSRKMFGNVRLAFGTVLENLRKSSEIHQKRRHQCVYIIKRTLHVSSKIWILCSSGKNNILEHKIHIFEPTCNVLFIIWRNQFNKSKRRES